jgi:galactoside O-acetyltransferase
MASRYANFLGKVELQALGVQATGENIQVHESVVLVNADKITLGGHIRIDPFCVLSAGAGIRLGRYIHIAAHCSLIGGGGIEINDFAGISHGAKLLSASDDLGGGFLTGPTVPPEFRHVVKAPIRIGRHAVLGAGAVVLPGVTVDDGAIVGALSLIRESIPPWTIWAGIPARQIGHRQLTVLELERQMQARATG